VQKALVECTKTIGKRKQEKSFLGVIVACDKFKANKERPQEALK